jgi:hypothetical protein
LLVEFEDGRPDSIFKKKRGKATPDWAPRFECAFSQLVDWLWMLDDMRSTGGFTTDFGDRHAKFHGLIVIGKGMSLGAQEKSRLRWREDKIMVSTRMVSPSFPLSNYRQRLIPGCERTIPCDTPLWIQAPKAAPVLGFRAFNV